MVFRLSTDITRMANFADTRANTISALGFRLPRFSFDR